MLLGLVALTATIALGAIIMLVWGLLTWVLFSRFSRWIWWHSYPLDRMIEIWLDVPEDKRRFS